MKTRSSVTEIMSDRQKATARKVADPPAESTATTRRRPGRPPGTDPSSKVTVVMYKRQIEALDDLCHAIYGKSRAKVTRTDVIRGILDAVFAEAKLDLSDVTSEADVRTRLAAKLGKPR